jgi:hypothetical protein
LRRTRKSGVDSFDEPVQDSSPHFVRADLVLDPMLEIRVVVDLDDDDRAVGFLDVDAERPRPIARAASSRQATFSTK